MEIRNQESFLVCGYSVETTSAQNDTDIAALYDEFFNNGKEAILMKLHGVQKGYYGLIWYVQGHERYCYLLGLEVGQVNVIPEQAIIKEAPKTTYACAYFQQGDDIIKSWTDFFTDQIPNAGYKVNEEFNVYFEYYPSNIHGDYELWVPVVRVD